MFSLRVLSIKFPSKYLLSILGILPIKCALKALFHSIFGITPTFKRLDVALSLIAFSKY